MPVQLNIRRVIKLYLICIAIILLLSSFESLNWFFHFSTIGTGILNYLTALVLLRLHRGHKVSLGIFHGLTAAAFIYVVITSLLNDSIELYFIELMVFLSYLLILAAIGLDEVKSEIQKISLAFVSTLSCLFVLFFSVKIVLTNELFADRMTGGFTNFGVFSMVLSLASLPLYQSLHVNRFRLIAAAPILFCIWISLHNETSIAVLIHIVAGLQFLTKVIQVRTRTKWLLFIITVCAIAVLFREGDSFKGRLNIWNVIVSNLEDIPLQGSGFNNFKVHFAGMQSQSIQDGLITDYNYDDPSYAFNELIQIYVEMGAFGLALLITFISFLVIRWLKTGKDFSSLFALLILTAFSFPLHQPELFLPFSLIIGYQIGLSNPIIGITVTNNLIFYRLVTVISTFSLVVYTLLMIDIIKWKNNSEEKTFIAKKVELTLVGHSVHLKNFSQSQLFASVQFGSPAQVIQHVLDLEKYTLNSDLMILKGEYYWIVHDYNRAITSLVQANRLIPYKILPKYYLAKIYKELKEPKKVDSLKQNILTTKPKIENNLYRKLIEQTRNL